MARPLLPKRPARGETLRSAFRRLSGATLKVYPKAPHGVAVIHKDQLNADLLAFIKG